jgi:3-hydroxyisobutyrate dehydrogenase-like beta-hydroxyacid dehydrogenase
MRVTTMTMIGFVGLGAMGSRMAGRLLDGNTVYGTNRTAAKARALTTRGMIWRDTPREVAQAPLILDLPEQAWFDVRLMHKDIRLALETAAELHVPVPSAAVSNALLTEAEDLGYGRRDIAAFFEVLAQTGGTAGAAADGAAGPAQAPVAAASGTAA